MKKSLKSDFTVIIVEDEFHLNRLIQIELEKIGYRTKSMYNGREVLEWFEKNYHKNDKEVFLFDYFLSDITAMELIEKLLEKKYDFPYIIMTGYGDEKIAVEMMKLGAYDYAVKEVDFIKILPMKIDFAIEHFRIERELTEIQENIIKSEQKYRSIFENIQDVYFEIGLDGTIKELSPSINKMFSFERNNLLEKKLIELAQNKNKSTLKKFLNYFQQNDTVANYEIFLNLKNGEIRYFTINAQLISYKYSSGKIITGTIRDITEKKEMENKIFNTIVETEEKERKRFAEDLHDGIGPLLSTLKIYLNLIGTDRLEHNKKYESLQAANEIIDETVHLTKILSNQLASNILNDYGLATAIQSFCNKVNFSGRLKINLKDNLKERLAFNVEAVLYRTIIELLNNSIKHSSASIIDIEIKKASHTLAVWYKDNGKGFDKEKILFPEKSGGFGLNYLINRLKFINAICEFDTSEGTKVKIELNLNIHQIK